MHFLIYSLDQLFIITGDFRGEGAMRSGIQGNEVSLAPHCLNGLHAAQACREILSL